ncbi:DNRLRE domain-containing protein [Streptomyces glaucescens]|uniref:DNRLRE domain-containing protein n=1 Tax=Streptomyces glaucescens TaxID=1907 RepID=UPI00117E23BF|nr:DNRLRE domain-containing protein [Streptomyces glaucescens]
MSDVEPRTPRRRRRVLAAAVALAVLAGGGAVLALRDDGPAAEAKAPSSRADRERLSAEDTAQRTARKTGKKVEVTALTDEFSKTHANPDGTFTYTVSAQPVRARNDKGTWAPIDTSLRRHGDGWRTVNSLYPVTFSGGGGNNARAMGGRSPVTPAAHRAAETAADWSPLLTMNAEAHTIEVEWPGALPEPAIDGDRALYEGVRPGVDLLLTARDTGFTHVLVVHTPEAAAALAQDPPRYRVTSPTLRFSLDPLTDVLTGRDGEGREIAVAPTPFLWDSAGTHDSDAAATGPEAATGTNEDPETVEEAPARPEAAPEEDNPEAPRPGAAEPGEAEPAAYSRSAASDTFGLPALHGPGDGAHATTVPASLGDDGVLTITPPDSYLHGGETLTYPLFLDPPIVGTRANWTTVYKKYPSSSFYDGANYNQDTKEARVGFERDTWGTARSFFRFVLPRSIKNADVSSATLKVLETHSWSCSKRTVQVWRTEDFGTRTTWNNQPDWKRKITSKSFAYGWKSNSSCPNAFVNFTVTSLAQEVADHGWTDFNIGLVASTSSSAPTGSATGLETDTYSWKKFKAEQDDSPSVSITYNRRPNTPTSVTMDPGSCDTSTSPYIKLGKSAPFLKAKGTDPDNDLAKMEFQVWRTNYYETTAKSHFDTSVHDGETASVQLGSLVNGYTYSWRVRGWDAKVSGPWAPTGGDGVCRFTYDSDFPDTPAPVVSTQFPGYDADNNAPEVWSPDPLGSSGNFTFSVGDPEENDIVKFVYSINNTSYSSYVCAGGKQGTTGGLTASCTTPVKTATATGIKPPTAGPNTLYVKSVDAAGNLSPAARKYYFFVTPRPQPDGPGDLTGDGSPDFGYLTTSGNLWIAPVTEDGRHINGIYGTHDKGVLLKDADTAPHIWDGNGTMSLVTHNGDFAPGDGISDWVIRTPEGRLFIYPGDGYGAIDVSRRVEVRLPSPVMSPATFSEIKSAGDITGDGQPELFVAGGAGGAELWVFTGYTGGTFTTATQLTTSAWADRDFVAITDYNKDGAADLTYRTASGNIWLRKGVKESDGTGTVLTSLGTAAASLDGDNAYASGTMLPADYPYLYGTPDTTGDGVPDIWAVDKAGNLLLYEGGATTIDTTPVTVRTDYQTVRQLG